MPRALIVHRVDAHTQPRDEALASFRNRREMVNRMGVNYWLFEDTAHGGEFTEFYEGPSAELVRDAATAAANAAGVLPAGAELESAGFLSEVEL
jgi:hypothetical protein